MLKLLFVFLSGLAFLFLLLVVGNTIRVLRHAREGAEGIGEPGFAASAYFALLVGVATVLVELAREIGWLL